MKKLFFLLPILMLVLSVNSCEDEDPSTPTAELTLNFKSVFGEEPLMMLSRNYDYVQNMDLQLQVFQFYVTNINLQKTDGSSIAIPDVALINFGDVYDMEAAALGKDFTIEIPTGDYSGISFGFGVEETLNNQKTPSDYEVGHPLTENWWGVQTGYIFFKMEANADVDGDGEFTETLSLHIGGDDNYNDLSFDRSFTLMENESQSLPFEVDLRRIIVDDTGNFVDFREVQVNHSTNSETATFMGQNVKEAVSLK